MAPDLSKASGDVIVRQALAGATKTWSVSLHKLAEMKECDALRDAGGPVAYYV